MMLRNRLYYGLKPMLPLGLRLRMRRLHAQSMRRRGADAWPILQSAGRPPAGWKGWPDGKQFALVLSHDVESRLGLTRVRGVAELEMELGFRSTFNLVPEGDYRVSSELRAWLERNGFEVGVHDLKHDGKLYQDRRGLAAKAEAINRYLERWGADGFRSAFMLHDLEWLLRLNIQYDSSTFDTDPFEPQPDGVGTIFPFPVRSSNCRQYIELPCTLPQDSTLFLSLQEKTIDIWRRKLDWIAEHGGMALLNVHPDYVQFDPDDNRAAQYPVARYREFLEYVRDRYGTRFWGALPREVAAHARGHLGNQAREESSGPGMLAEDLSPPDRAVWRLRGKRAAVLLFSSYPADPRPRRAAEALVKAGMAVDVFCIRESADEPERERIGDVEVWRLPLRRSRGGKGRYLLEYGWFILRSALWLAWRTARQPYDVVHVHNMPDVLVFAAMAAKLRGARIILDLHDPMPELLMSIYGLAPDNRFVSLLRFLERASIGFSDLALTPNKAFRDLFVSRSCSPSKMNIVMNSPNEEVFRPQGGAAVRPPTARPDTCAFRLMFHGFIAERHGLDVALRAVALLRGSFPGIQFSIFGRRTPYLAIVEQMIGDLGLEANVTYHGPKSLPDIARAIETTDLGIIPNRRNPFTELNLPTRIFEYLAMGKPVIAPDTRGIRDYFSGDELLFCRPGDPEDLAARILWVIGHPAEVSRIVERGRQVYQDNRWTIQERRFVGLTSSMFEPCSSDRRSIAEAS